MHANRSIPECTVIPELAYPDVGQAIGWLGTAFGFTLRIRIANHRAQLNVGDGAIVLTFGGRGEGAHATTVDRAHSVVVRVEDVEGHFARATAHGARVLREPTTYPYGERQYTVEDPAGHVWTFSQSVADVAPGDWGGVAGTL